MPLSANSMPEAEVDFRRHERVELSLSGRYLVDGGHECACTTINISPEGIAVTVPGHSATVGDHVVAYFSHLGRMEGIVVRQFDRGFVIKLAAATQGQDALVRKIAAAMRRRRGGAKEDRANREIEISPRQFSPMSPKEFDNLTAVVRELLERSAA